jgi:hypothetical protein
MASAVPQDYPMHPNSPYKSTGPLHRDIAENSPVAKEVIMQTTPRSGYEYKIAIRATISNITDHPLRYVDAGQYYDVRNRKTGQRPLDTPIGCYVNFFSECYTPSMPVGKTSFDLPTIIPPRGSIDTKPDQYIDMYYKLDTGEYTVVGYYCAAEREDPECFKSNTIMITIPEASQQ